MNIGRLDRDALVTRNEPTRSADGGAVDNWVSVARYRVGFAPTSGAFGRIAERHAGKESVQFVARWDGRIAAGMRLTCEGVTYDIQSAREQGRRQYVLLDCRSLAS